MARDFDLLGDPIPENKGKPGANGHVATAENVNKVRLLVIAGWRGKEIAEELGISVPTLNKHYFKNRSIKVAKSHSLAEAKGRVLLQLQMAANEGNVSAMKEIKAIVEKEELALIGGDIGKGKAKQPKKGKKDQQLDAAAEAQSSMSDVLPDYNKPDRPH